jgi:hypothetical protein
MFRELTPTEAGRLDSALFGSLERLEEVGQFGEPYQSPPHTDMWDETADILGDLRGQHEYMPPETADFRLSKRQEGAS